MERKTNEINGSTLYGRKTKERNGSTLYRRYALYNFGLDQLEQEIQEAKPEIDTSNPYEISAQVGECEEDDKKWCVEYYWADENGEFVEGSDYDTATAHYERFHVQEGK